MFCWCGSLLSNIEVKKGEKKNNTVEPVLVLLLVPTPKGDRVTIIDRLRFHCSNNNNNSLSSLTFGDCSRRLAALTLASFCNCSPLTSRDSSRRLVALRLASFFCFSSFFCADSNRQRFF